MKSKFVNRAVKRSERKGQEFVGRIVYGRDVRKERQSAEKQMRGRLYVHKRGRTRLLLKDDCRSLHFLDDLDLAVVLLDGNL